MIAEDLLAFRHRTLAHHHHILPAVFSKHVAPDLLEEFVHPRPVQDVLERQLGIVAHVFLWGGAGRTVPYDIDAQIT